MVTSFVQVGIEGFERLLGRSHSTVALGPVVIGIMTSTIVVKGACWVWCRTVRNSSVQALASDAVTDGTTPSVYISPSVFLCVADPGLANPSDIQFFFDPVPARRDVRRRVVARPAWRHRAVGLRDRIVVTHL